MVSFYDNSVLSFLSNVDTTLTGSTRNEIEAAKVDAYNVRQKVLSWLDGLETFCEHGGAPELASKLPESGLDLVVDRANLNCESCVSLTDAELISESNARSGYKVLDKGNCKSVTDGSLDDDGMSANSRRSSRRAKEADVRLKLAKLSFELAEDRSYDEGRVAELKAKLKTEECAMKSREARRKMMFAEAEKRAWGEVSTKDDDVVSGGKRYEAKVNSEPTKEVIYSEVKASSKLASEVKCGPNKKDTEPLAHKETFTGKFSTAEVPYPPADGARAPYPPAQNVSTAGVPYPSADGATAPFPSSRRSTSARVPCLRAGYAGAIDPLGPGLSEPYQPKTFFSCDFGEHKFTSSTGDSTFLSSQYECIYGTFYSWE